MRPERPDEQINQVDKQNEKVCIVVAIFHWQYNENIMGSASLFQPSSTLYSSLYPTTTTLWV